jgi:hypothetical protein
MRLTDDCRGFTIVQAVEDSPKFTFAIEEFARPYWTAIDEEIGRMTHISLLAGCFENGAAKAFQMILPILIIANKKPVFALAAKTGSSTG